MPVNIKQSKYIAREIFLDVPDKNNRTQKQDSKANPYILVICYKNGKKK